VIAKISKLCRSSDPIVALKAVAALADYEKAERLLVQPLMMMDSPSGGFVAIT